MRKFYLFYPLFILMGAAWLTSCTTTGKIFKKEIDSQLIYSHDYFQKRIPLIVWHSKAKPEHSDYYNSATFFFYETDLLVKKGYLKPVDSVATNLYGFDGMKVFYEPAEKAKPYLTKLHYDTVSKKPDSAWFNAYRLRSLEIDSFYTSFSNTSVDEEGNRLSYEGRKDVIVKVEYDTTPMFDLYDNPRNITVNFENLDNKKMWKISSIYPMAYLVIGVYNPLNRLNSCTDYYEDNIVFPDKLKEWLQQWWLHSKFSSFL
jgi:hypothetical protein